MPLSYNITIRMLITFLHVFSITLLTVIYSQYNIYRPKLESA